MRHHIRARGLEGQVEVDSAGTGDWHAGETADPRTLATLQRAGVPHHGQARQLREADFEDFDLILAMDAANLRDIQNWPKSVREKVHLFVPEGVADPYYGGPDGFDKMYHRIDEECVRLLSELVPPRSPADGFKDADQPS